MFFKKKYDECDFDYRVNFLGNAEEIALAKEALCIDLEFYGDYQGRRLSLWGSYQYLEETRYDEMLAFLMQHQNSIAVKVQIQSGNAKTFRVNFEDMAQKLNNSEIRKLEPIAWKVTHY